jgi:hypothetical protein
MALLGVKPQGTIRRGCSGRPFRIDPWNFETADKRSIRKALNGLIPFTTG